MKESNCVLNDVDPHNIAYAVLFRGVAGPGAKATYDVMPNDFKNWGTGMRQQASDNRPGRCRRPAMHGRFTMMIGTRPEGRYSGAGEPKAPARRRNFVTQPSRACYIADRATKVAGSIYGKRGLTSAILTAADSA